MVATRADSAKEYLQLIQTSNVLDTRTEAQEMLGLRPRFSIPTSTRCVMLLAADWLAVSYNQSHPEPCWELAVKRQSY